MMAAIFLQPKCSYILTHIGIVFKIFLNICHLFLVLIHSQNYSVALVVATLIGAGKALRTIFAALIIPSYVPIEKLPAASGLHFVEYLMLFLDQ